MLSRRRLVIGSAAGVLAGLLGAPDPARTTARAASEWPILRPRRRTVTVLGQVLDEGAAIAGLRSIVLVRAGALLAERYYADAHADTLQPLNSITKSVTSVLVGQALQRGRLPSLCTPVRQLLPRAAAQPQAAAAQLRLEQLLNARSGLRYDYLGQYDALMASSDPIAMALEQAADPAAAGQWRYNDPVIGLLSPILAHAQGLDLEALARRDLFAPLGISQWQWARDALGQPMSYAGLSLRPRDLAKLVWMMANGGRWQHVQVVPAAWVAASTRAYGTAQWTIAPLRNIGYGYLWFNGCLDQQRAVWGWGYGGQFALWLPHRRLAVVSSATSPEAALALPQAEAIMHLLVRLLRQAPRHGRFPNDCR